MSLELAHSAEATRADLVTQHLGAAIRLTVTELRPKSMLGRLMKSGPKDPEGRWHFFFQAEDGIRDDLVTGVQTCALPISVMCYFWNTFDQVMLRPSLIDYFEEDGLKVITEVRGESLLERGRISTRYFDHLPIEIGRASCRQRAQISVVAVSLKKKQSRGCC